MQPSPSHRQPSSPRRPIVTLSLSDSVSAALEAAHRGSVHHFAVRHRGRVVGMVCACDLEMSAPERMLGEVMHPAVMLPETRSPAEAAMLMQAARVGAVLVTNDTGEPCGVVTRAELSTEPSVSALFEDYRCLSCGTIHHLHQRGDRRPCFSCRHRAPEARARVASGPHELSMRGE